MRRETSQPPRNKPEATCSVCPLLYFGTARKTIENLVPFGTPGRQPNGWEVENVALRLVGILLVFLSVQRTDTGLRTGSGA